MLLLIEFFFYWVGLDLFVYVLGFRVFYTINLGIWIHNPFPPYLLKSGKPSRFKTKIPLN